MVAAEECLVLSHKHRACWVGIQIASVKAAGTCLNRVDMAFAEFEEPCCEGSCLGRMHEVPCGHGTCFGQVRTHIESGVLVACLCDRVHVGMAFVVLVAAYYAACAEEECFEEEYYAERSFEENHSSEACWG